jgi:calcineurin-like phosphoesterase family protein
MSEVFVISDTHFGHEKVLTFEHEGEPLRPFKSVTEMHVEMIDRWNRVVTPRDKVYHLGDVAWSKEGLHLMAMLNGKKRLVRGNHDLFKARLYLDYFQEIYGVRQINGIWMTHTPMHLDGVEQDRVKLNVHGHLHANKIDHPKYKNVSVECVDYTPVPFDELLIQ